MNFDKAAWDRAQRQIQAADRRFAKKMEALRKAAQGKARIPSFRTVLSRAARASRHAGSWNKAGKVVSLLFKKHAGGHHGDAYASRAKDGHLLCTNMLGRTPAERLVEFELDAARHPMVAFKRLIIHCSLSRPAGQDLTPAQWIKVVRQFLRKSGASDANFVAIRHRDTDNDHVHIIFSRALPSGRLLSDSNDFWKFREASRATSSELGLDVLMEQDEAPQAPTDRAVSAQRRATRRGTDPDVWVAPELISDALEHAVNFDEFESRLKLRGIEVKLAKRGTDQQVTGVMFRRDGAQEYLAGSSISPHLSLPKLQAQIELSRQAHALLMSRQRDAVDRQRLQLQSASHPNLRPRER